MKATKIRVVAPAVPIFSAGISTGRGKLLHEQTNNWRYIWRILGFQGRRKDEGRPTIFRKCKFLNMLHTSIYTVHNKFSTTYSY